MAEGTETSELCQDLLDCDLDGIRSERIKQLRKERGGIKSAITIKQSEIKQLINNTKDVNNAEKLLHDIDTLLDDIRGKHCEYRSLIKRDRAEIEAAEQYLNSIFGSHEQIKNDFRKWALECNKECLDNINPEDSASQAGESNTSAASLLKKARAKKAILLSRARALVKKQELDRRQRLLEEEQFKLKQEEERLGIEQELYEAQAEEQLYAEDNEECQDKQEHSTLKPTTLPVKTERSPHLVSKSTLDPSAKEWTFEHKGLDDMISRDMDNKLSGFETQGYERYQRTYKQENLQNLSYQTGKPVDKSNFEQSNLRKPPTGERLYNNYESTDYVSSNRFQQFQKQMIDIMQLPKAEMKVFDGNPLKYWTFIRSFENSVDHTTTNAGIKLNRLLQYCSGKALAVIECCTVMDPEYGYPEARRLLQERFGNQFSIAKSWVSKVTERTCIRPNDCEGLQAFADDLRACVMTLQTMGRLGEIDNQIRMLKMVEKLPFFLQNGWRKLAVQIRRNEQVYPGIIQFLRFVEEAAEEANDPVFGSPVVSSYNKGKVENSISRPKGSSFNVQLSNSKNGSEVLQTRQEDSVRILSCHKCHGNHPLVRCEQFKQLSPDKRIEFVRSKKLCFNCFSAKHLSIDCVKSSRCSVDGCRRKHSRFLHGETRNVTESHPEVNTTSNRVLNGQISTVSGNSYSRVSSGRKIALPIVPVKVRASCNQPYIETYALLDSGSTNTFCSQELKEALGLKGEAIRLPITTIEKTDSSTNVEKIAFDIADLETRNVMHLSHVFCLSKFPSLDDRNTDVLEACSNWPHLRDVNIPVISNKSVTLLIGQDVPLALTPIDVRRGKAEEPYATRTILGWALNGPLSSTRQESLVSTFIQSETDLSSQIEKFWKLDSCVDDDAKQMSANDKQVMQLWDRTTEFVEGHYVMHIPFKRRCPELPDNYYVAETRLETLGRRLRKDQTLFEKYKVEIKKMVDNGFAEKVDANTPTEPGKVWYLPHHGVKNVNKPEKLRVVFDCSSTFCGRSLNNEVLQGPDLTSSLIGVLLRFREDKIAIMGDIEAMFHQVRVKPEDRDVLRFLWWENDNIAMGPETYRMKVHLFGGVWSPSCANYALRRTAQDNKQNFHSSISDTVMYNFYMDDCLRSLPTVQETIRMNEDLCKLLQNGGFNITKWTSNSREVIEAIPEIKRAKNLQDIDLTKVDLPTERALGVHWETESDHFGLKVVSTDRPITRRGLIGVISSVYDPLGFVCPFILQAKKIFQDETRRQKDWDSPLDPGNELKWRNWKEGLKILEHFKIARCLQSEIFSGEFCHQLHHFSDASQDGYGCVTYLRSLDSSGVITCSFIIGKSRLAPIKTQSIPRLELSASVLSARMDQILRKEFDSTQLKIEQSYFWTDSMIVLQYIANKTKRFKTFVSNRISAILERSSPSQWRHVQSINNPADDASRGLDASAMLNNDRWKSGPEFLWLDESTWPKTAECIPDLPDGDPEVKAHTGLCGVICETSDNPLQRLFQRYSSWHKLKKAVAWFLRLKNILFQRIQGCSPVLPGSRLTVSEINMAETEIVRVVQREYFSEELNDLMNKSEVVKRSSSIFKLEPIMDSNGILCVSGRLTHRTASFSARDQMILPRDSHVTTLIVRWYHETTAHSGKEYVLAKLRESFWVVRARRTIDKVLRSCVQCKRLWGRTATQRMADLPQDRIASGKPPFSVVGVDCFGPFYVKRGRCQIKRYGCIFTCLSIRAIHIEKLDTMETDSFINALKRFECRRGVPEKIRSDNGSNFTGAERELKEAILAWNQNKIEGHLQQRAIHWEFNPPTASHMGGVWERQIRTVRKVLSSLFLSERSLDDESLSTLFCEVEAIINNRPLTHNSDSPTDMLPLTPNHLLLLRSSMRLSVGKCTIADTYKRRWKHVQSVADQFWKRWVREYLPTIQLRSKWLKPERNFHVGDIVLIKDENTCRGKWPLGRVTKVFPGKDGLVRSVELQTSCSVLSRPIHKLCLLEAECEQ